MLCTVRLRGTDILARRCTRAVSCTATLRCGTLYWRPRIRSQRAWKAVLLLAGAGAGAGWKEVALGSRSRA